MGLKKKFLINIFYAFGAQFISIILSLTLVLGLPKVISIEEYGFWQLFILYNSFIGLFLLGLSDGIYLSYGGKEFKDLEADVVKSKLTFTFILQLLFSFVISISVLCFYRDTIKATIIISSCVFLIIGNLITFLGFILLATDRIKEFSKSIFLEKGVFLSLIFLLFFSHQLSLYNIIIGFLASKIISLLFLLHFYKDLKNAKRLSFKKTISLIKADCIFGISLMLANLTDTCIIGIGKLAIEYHWDIKTFAKISLSLSAVFFFIVLITQLSLVLFPTLRKFSTSQQGKALNISIDFLSFLLLGLYLGYYPLIYFLTNWLPKYQEGLSYLIVLMPICLYEGKMQIVNKTYIKVLNKQNLLLAINFCILLLCSLGTVAAVFYFDSLSGVVYSILGCIVLRSIVVQIILYKIYEIRSEGQIINDLVLSIVFVSLTVSYSPMKAFFAYGILYILFLFLERKKMRNILKYVIFNR